MVANCRVKITTSRVLTPFRKAGSLIWVGASRTLTRIIRFLRMKAMTSSRVGTSRIPRMICPLVEFLAVYSKSPIVVVLAG